MAFLHVISGPQSGALIQLEKNKLYTVSSDVNGGDIFISADVDYSFDFSINDLGIIFSKVNGKILFADDRSALTEDKLYLFDCAIKFSKVAIVFSLNSKNVGTNNQKEQDWQDLGEDVDDEAGANSAQKPDSNLLIQLMVILGITLRFLLDKLILLKARLGKAFYPAIAMFLLVMISSVIIMYLFSVEKHRESLEYAREKVVDSRKSVEKILINLPQDDYRGIAVSYEKDDIVIKGILPDIEALNSLKKILSKVKNVHLVYKVVLFSQVEKNTLNSCRANNIIGAKVTIDQNSGLTVFVSGIAGTNDDINNLEIELHNEFPDLEQIDTSRIFVESEIENYWTNLLLQMKQQVAVNYNFDKGVVYLNGVLSKDNLITLNNAVNEFNQKYLNVVKAVPSVTDVVSTLSFGIKEVFINNNSSWLVTNDGHVLFEGGAYKGVTLLKIDPDVLTFRSNFDFAIPMDELMNSLGESHIKGKMNDPDQSN